MSTSEHKASNVQLTQPSGGAAGTPRKRRNPFTTAIVVIGGIVIVLAAIGLWARAGESKTVEATPTVKAARGPLTVSVTVGGTLQAMENLDVKSQVQGNNQILFIVPEGTVVTDQDVADSKVLVQLDTSSLEDQQASRAIDVQSAQANYVQAQQNLLIQKKQNESDIATAELTLKFAKMTLSQYLGDGMAQVLLAGNFDFTELTPLASYEVESILTQNEQPATTDVVPASGMAPAASLAPTGAAPAVPAPALPAAAAALAAVAAAQPAAAASAPPAGADPAGAPSSTSALLSAGTATSGAPSAAPLNTQVKASEVLGDLYHPLDKTPAVTLAGTAEQSLRQYSSAVQLANQDLLQSANTLEWTKKLVASNYETLNQLATDQLAFDRNQVALTSSIEDLRLFIRFNLPKQAEQDYSDYLEAQRNLDRVQASAAGQLAQAEASLASKQATLKLNQDQYDKGQQMLADSVIKATKPGMVVYASTTDPRHFQNNPIQEGTQVRENETIFSLPNMKTLAAHVSVYETDISKIKVGQPAIITVGAIRGKSYAAHVAKISPMASSENRWLNPDVMVYDTDVALNSVPGDGSLTAGMSATAQIIVAQLKDVIYVPIQAVATHQGQRIVYIQGPTGPQRRNVTTGYYTDKFVEITQGLNEGETVYLAPPPGMAEEAAAGAQGGQNEEQGAGATEEGQQQPAAGAEGAQGGQPAQQGAEAGRSGQPGQPGAGQSGQQGAGQPGEQGAGEGRGRGMMGQIDPALAQKLGELRGLSGAERDQKMQEIINSLPEDQRAQAQQIMQRMSQWSGRGGRGGQGRGQAGRAQGGQGGGGGAPQRDAAQ